MEKPKVIITGSQPWWHLNLREVWGYRDLFLVLAYRDLRVRYAQTFLGFLWAVLQPVATLLIFTLIFGRAINVDTGAIPYPVYAMSGMMVWSYFAFVMAQSGQSIIGSQEMVKKIYFPRVILPLSKALVGLVELIISFILFLGLLFFYGVGVTANSFWFLFYFSLAIVCALSVGIWLSAVTIRFRDFQHVVPFLVQIGLYATPIAYPVKLIPERYQLLFHLNPMAGVVEGVRWSLLGGEPPHVFSNVSFALIAILFTTALFYFKRTEKIMADLV